jgi:hypothetical protein
MPILLLPIVILLPILTYPCSVMLNAPIRLPPFALPFNQIILLESRVPPICIPGSSILARDAEGSPIILISPTEIYLLESTTNGPIAEFIAFFVNDIAFAEFFDPPILIPGNSIYDSAAFDPVPSL